MFTNIEPDALDFICSRDSSHSAIGNSELKEVSCSTVEEREREYRERVSGTRASQCNRMTRWR